MYTPPPLTFRVSRAHVLPHIINAVMAASRADYVPSQLKMAPELRMILHSVMTWAEQVFVFDKVLRWYPSGRIAAEYNYKNSRPEGDWKEWYDLPGSPLKWLCTYVNGFAEGFDIKWWPHVAGQRMIKRRTSYIRGRREGPELKCYPSGWKKTEWYYVNGQLSGIQLGWYDGGGKSYEVSVNNGKYHGIYRAWSVEGTIICDITFVNGIAINARAYHNM